MTATEICVNPPVRHNWSTTDRDLYSFVCWVILCKTPLAANHKE